MVGVVALIVAAVEFATVAVPVNSRDRPPVLSLLAAGQSVLLCVAWAVANSVAARRG